MELARKEDDLIRELFAFTLDASKADPATSPPVVHLKGLAEELADEAPDAPSLLSRATLERALMARLMEPPASYPLWPVPYLLGSFGRASDRFRGLPGKGHCEELQALAMYAKELAVSYTGLLLTLQMFPQPRQAEARGSLQLLDALAARSQNSPDAIQMPLDFLDRFATRFESEGLQQIVSDISRELMRQLTNRSAIGDFQEHLGVLTSISTVRPLARAFTSLQDFLPESLSDGRAIAFHSLLGPAFSLALLTDRVSPQKPDVRKQYFSNMDGRSAAGVASAVSALQLTANQVAGMLHAIVRNLLKKDTREQMLAWLFAAVESNGERAKTMPNYTVAAPDGFFLNLAAVCIKLCQPFLEPSRKAWDSIKDGYVTWNSRIDFSEETKLSASQEEERTWLAERRASGGETSASPPSYSFTCEAFFLTAKVLHLGPLHVLSHRNSLAQQIQRLDGETQQMANMVNSMEGTPQAAMYQTQQQRLLAALDAMKGEVTIMDAHLQDPAAIADLLSYYRLMAAWLLHLTAPTAITSGDIHLPLPTPAPMPFRTLPEYFLEDVVDVLEWVAQALPSAMETMPNNEFVNLVIIFLGSPAYIKNAHLRARLVDLLHIWITPQLAEEDRPSNMRRTSAISSLTNLIEWHPLVQQNMVRGLLQLFFDIEHTDRHNTFFEKFTTRYKAGEILCYLWTIPQHRQVWKVLAGELGGRGLYLQFCDVICNDSQYLLDDVIKTLPELRQMEDLMADTAAWEALTPAERAEKQKHHSQNTHNLQADLYLASVYIRVMKTTTEEITGTWLLPEMVSRVAAMLDYFLDHLAGKEKRKNLRVRDPEKYKWKPAELLASLARIYLNLAAADPSGAFTAAIANDERSFHEGLFSDAADVLRKYGLLAEEEVDGLEALGEKAQTARLSAAADEDLLGEVPDEFLDPVTFELMTDPVSWPRSGGGEVPVMDRASITRHLLSSPYDPFNKQPLSANQLVPEPEMKARINAWKVEQRMKRQAQPMQD